MMKMEDFGAPQKHIPLLESIMEDMEIGVTAKIPVHILKMVLLTFGSVHQVFFLRWAGRARARPEGLSYVQNADKSIKVEKNC